MRAWIVELVLLWRAQFVLWRLTRAQAYVDWAERWSADESRRLREARAQEQVSDTP